MKKFFVTLFCCAAAGLFAADAAKIIVPPAGKVLKMPMGDQMTTEAGGFIVDFTPDFKDPNKDYVGYMISCRNWKKPFKGFLFGVNRIKGKTAIWFYPMDENGKVFGFYKYYDEIKAGKRHRAEISYQGRRCVLKVDGKVVVSTNLRADITIFDTIEIGGLGNKYRDVIIHGFQFVDIKKK